MIGAVILAVAVAFCWADVALGQRVGAAMVRTVGSAPLAETLFSLVLFAPLIVAGLIGGAVERRSAAMPGKRPGAGLLIGIATGLAGLTVAVGFARIAGVLTDGAAATPAAAILLWGAVVVGIQVAAEEIYFRGWLQPALVRRWGERPGLIAAALAFAALHVAGGARGPISLINLFVGGLVFGLFAARTGGIAAAVGAHWAWNAAEQLIWGLDPNPGVGSFGAVWNRELVGRAIWGGSPDGLNGGIGMTVALLAILLPLAAWAGQPTSDKRVLSPQGSTG